MLIGPVSVDTVRPILLGEFAKALGRPLQAVALTPAEASRARQMARRLTSTKYLNLHNENGPATPMKSLKIAAGVFIRAAKVNVNGHRVRASFRVREGMIEDARLESEPIKLWQQFETELRGLPFKEWHERLEVGERNS